SQFVAGFIGTPPMNLIAGRTRKADAGWMLDLGAISLPLQGNGFDLADGRKVVLGVRPQDLSLATGSETSSMSGEVLLVEFHGNEVLVSIAFNDKEVSALIPASTSIAIGSRARFSVDERRLHLFDAETG